MPELPEAYPNPLDLSRYSEKTRRELYDRIVGLNSQTGQPFDPDAAGLVVFHILGRWFAFWTDLDASPELPDALRVEVVRIQSANSSDGFMLYEV